MTPIALLRHPGQGWDPSDAHVPEREQSCEKYICLNAFSRSVPIPECLLCTVHQVDHVLSRESTCRVVVGFVARLLKIDERRRNSSELRLDCLAVHPRAELRRDPTVRELLRHSLHVAVDERASQATSQSSPIAARKHALRCLVDQQVKESVVRRGNGPAKACLRRAPGFLEGKLSGLPQQVCVQAQGGLDGFGSGAKSHVDPRPVIGLVPDVVAHDFSQLRTRLEIDALVLQHDPHPHCGVVRRIRTRFQPATNLPGREALGARQVRTR